MSESQSSEAQCTEWDATNGLRCMVDGCTHVAGSYGRCAHHAVAKAVAHREMWVLEREQDDGEWLPSGVAATTMKGGLAALEANRAMQPALPANWLRLTRYVPAPTDEPFGG